MIEVSTHSTRKGAALHLRGCGWSRFLPVVNTVPLTAANSARTCRNCRKAIRIALDAARDTNAARTECSYTVKTAKAATERHLVELVELFRTPAELVAEA